MARRVPGDWDDVAKLLADVKKYKMEQLCDGKAAIIDLLKMGVTKEVLSSLRMSLTLHIVNSLGMQCFNMRTGPVTETRQYLSPVQQKLVASELDAYSPPLSDPKLPTTMHRLADHLETSDWAKVSLGPGARSAGDCIGYAQMGRIKVSC